MKDRAQGRKTCKQGRIVAKNGQNIYNKSMKKVISVALVAILIVTTALTFTGCIFNTGAEKEVYGVYGVDRMFYNSYDGKRIITPTNSTTIFLYCIRVAKAKRRAR